jgi:hypothetical protein
MNDILINQSMVKDLIKYKKRELCGLIFMNKWILHQYGKGSKANDLGHYFEFLCTGALAKGETKPPEPERTKNGELSSAFLVAKKQSEYFQTLKAKYGFSIASAGEKVIADGQWVGTLDIKAKWDSVFDNFNHLRSVNNPDNLVIIDLKYSGVLEDKFNEYSWHYETLPRKEGTMMQAKHYKFLFWKEYGYNPPFFFFVFDSKNIGIAKMIYIDIDEYELKQYEQFLLNAKSYLIKQLDKGFEPISNYQACTSCAYNSLCMFKTDVPPIITIKPN